MGLLLLFHLGSGLVHPCCLGGAEGAEHSGMHGAAHAGAGADDVAPVHAAGTAADVAHGVMDHGETTAPVHASHAGDDESHDEGDCQGVCGLCCSSVDQMGAPAPTLTATALFDAVPAPALPPVDAVLPPTPAYLLPPANAPPGSVSLLG